MSQPSPFESACLWRQDWRQCSPLFANLQQQAAATSELKCWPEPASLAQHLQLQNIKLVSQTALDQAGMSYESYVAEFNAVPTRNNWHDFFNAVIWSQLPYSKKLMNQLHVADIQRYGKPRSKRRDALTLLDECGVLLLCSESKWRDALNEHRWHDLFWHWRSGWGKTISPLVVGHALYEQAFAPHLGWCGKALVLMVDDDFAALSLAQQYAEADRLLAAKLPTLESPRQLKPLPILGVPGWHQEPIEASFFDDQSYFRPKRID
ncbi:DUF3025 domain-containing protein [Neiella sp. HB171785]|uniref:DUF3025 domain-containing protein n=1 Tax=Neiella litorisoli TaxID=2771431 RepID=A0A8J6UH59_9GAMM|nr:DUF3025 domain-containing protein [Neiella litorisoli]MBD1391246.1 DUF3025 domain-containing protein [Neiella litorisoli]